MYRKEVKVVKVNIFCIGKKLFALLYSVFYLFGKIFCSLKFFFYFLFFLKNFIGFITFFLLISFLIKRIIIALRLLDI